MILSADSFVPLTLDRDTDGTVVRVTGEVDFTAAPTLERALLDLVAEGPADVAIDLSGVRFLSVTALDALLRVRRRAGAAGCRFRIVEPSPAVRRLLTISGTCVLLTGSTEAETSWPVHRAPRGEVTVAG